MLWKENTVDIQLCLKSQGGLSTPTRQDDCGDCGETIKSGDNDEGVRRVTAFVAVSWISKAT